MKDSLRQESEKLARSWMRHEAGWLRDYLVAGVEDPRLNIQSILSRHFVVRRVCGDRFGFLMEQEYRFAAVMNWLLSAAGKMSEIEELEAVLFGLRRGADDVEGMPIPPWALQAFAALPVTVDDVGIPNYVERFLTGARFAEGRLVPDTACLDTFLVAWREALHGETVGSEGSKPSLVEPACGSANDFRFLHAFGIARLIDYTGFDLCATNVENARALFPSVRFQTGNVFEIAAADLAFDLCVVHDLLEHLSFEGLEAAVKEICRVTRRGICAGFFQMDEIPQHVLRPVDEYHWNLLSMTGMKKMFYQHGFAAQALHIGSFLREIAGCDRTHNPNAYTFLLKRE
ncbi:MAG TPA: class I SAM-dependent methyltransferase [Verrucomicrobiae bacterium]